MRWYLNRLPDHTRVTIFPIAEPSQEALEAEDWLRTAVRPAVGPRPAAPGTPSDFTARVMARIETPTSTPQPIAVAPRRQPLGPMLRPLGIVGGAVGFSGLLVLASLVVAFLLAPAALILLLNTLVGVLVSALLLLTPLFDAAAVLAANNALMLALSALVAGFVVVWSRVQTSSAQLAREA